MICFRVVILVGVLAASNCLGIIPTETAGAQESGSESGGPYQNYITWNMCQSVCHESDAGRRNVTDKLRRLSSVLQPSRGPSQLKEMCREEFNELDAQIDGYGYDSIFSRAKNTGECPASEGGVGNALFWRGYCTTGCRVQEPFGSSIQAPGDDAENRGYACGRTNEWDAWYCSVHITSKSEPYNNTPRYHQLHQIATMRLQSATWRENSRTTVMMGDFNVRPDQAGVGMSMFYDLHTEADSCFTNALCMKTHEVKAGDLGVFDRKFDYVFGSDTASADTDCDRQGAAPAVRRYASLSDHTLLRGYLICPSD